MQTPQPPQHDLKKTLYVIIFESDTPAGKAFDVGLIAVILASVVVVMLDSVTWLNERYGALFLVLEWIMTVAFTIEYGLRLYCSPQPLRYARSFYGLVDLISILPSYLGLIFPDAHYILVVRMLRVLRVFRILRLTRYMQQANVLMRALRASRQKITVFLFAVLTLVTVFGALIYLVEGPDNGFTSIPRSMYWAIVTLTTVGYGDIAPQSPFGQFLASVVMITGYAIIAVPTGIVTTELATVIRDDKAESAGRPEQPCLECGKAAHAVKARYCDYCGTRLQNSES